MLVSSISLFSVVLIFMAWPLEPQVRSLAGPCPHFRVWQAAKKLWKVVVCWARLTLWRSLELRADLELRGTTEWEPQPHCKLAGTMPYPRSDEAKVVSDFFSFFRFLALLCAAKCSCRRRHCCRYCFFVTVHVFEMVHAQV